MLTLAVIVLLLGAVFNIVAWPQFLRRVSADPRARDAQGNATRFLTVHRVLVGIALGIAVLSVVAAVGLLLA
ncbi:hypothetical protein CLV46_0419 [Diaminobutyricimonas aerilata]|uniref:Integral membrane protein n=1 Tax=Diaminobutyricimonas aerilata TaxID=1162967 RepID=A0A2M9CGA0_9MICO|nr:hypothetical protein [Diaminobutyricimonas aerilata]PJJ70890.1 hypothetical protein CLV46_0419 [Diaminobutyricimonas aerilata]